MCLVIFYHQNMNIMSLFPCQIYSDNYIGYLLIEFKNNRNILELRKSINNSDCMAEALKYIIMMRKLLNHP